jgi:integrase/recombinase XerD
MDNTVARKHVDGSKTGQRSGDGLYARDGRRKYLNRDERRRALAVTATLEPTMALFAQTLAWTGARVSEVLALTPASFQIERGVVAIVTLKRRRFSVREVPLPANLLAAIEVHFGIRAAQLDPLGCKCRLWEWHRTTAWRLIKDIMRRCNVVGRPASPRGFRHGFGVGALQAKVPLNLVQRWLGHSRISTTAIYADAAGPEEIEFAGRFWSL